MDLSFSLFFFFFTALLGSNRQLGLAVGSTGRPEKGSRNHQHQNDEWWVSLFFKDFFFTKKSTHAGRKAAFVSGCVAVEDVWVCSLLWGRGFSPNWRWKFRFFSSNDRLFLDVHAICLDGAAKKSLALVMPCDQRMRPVDSNVPENQTWVSSKHSTQSINQSIDRRNQ